MTAAQFRRQFAKIKPPAEPVAMLRQINEVWPNEDLAALPQSLDARSLVDHFLQERFLRDPRHFRDSGIERPETPDSIFDFTVLPRPFGYLCEISFVAGPECGFGAGFQFSHTGILEPKEEVSMWIS